MLAFVEIVANIVQSMCVMSVIVARQRICESHFGDSSIGNAKPPPITYKSGNENTKQIWLQQRSENGMRIG